MSRADRATFPDPSGRTPAPNTLTAILGHNDQPWMSHPGRNCRPPESSWPEGIREHANKWFPPSARAEGQAAAGCNGCPVSPECMAYALAHPEVDGIWAGTTKRERREIRAAARTRKRGAA